MVKPTMDIIKLWMYVTHYLFSLINPIGSGVCK